MVYVLVTFQCFGGAGGGRAGAGRACRPCIKNPTVREALKTISKLSNNYTLDLCEKKQSLYSPFKGTIQSRLVIQAPPPTLACGYQDLKILDTNTKH